MAERRTLLGRDASLGLRTHVFLTADGLEVDEVDGVNVVRTRVLLDDILLVTLHRREPWGLFWAMLLFLMAAGFSLGVFPQGQARLVAALVFFPVPTLLLGSTFFGVHYVTVFGLRSKARMGWRLSKRRARQVFELLVERVAYRQRP